MFPPCRKIAKWGKLCIVLLLLTVKLSSRTVAKPPALPTLFYDGECTFCCLWVARWKQLTGPAVDYQTSQSAGDRYPEITVDEFAQAAWLVHPDGRAVAGAEGVLMALAVRPGLAWLLWLYASLPWMARLFDQAYHVVATNRSLFSRTTRLLWGRQVAAADFRLSGWLFPRALGAVSLLALGSYWVQWQGLIGADGILPAENFFPQVRAYLEAQNPPQDPFWAAPSVFWLIGANDYAVWLVLVTSSLAATCLLAGLIPAPATLCLFVGYLSLTVAGQVFFQFQWDSLLISLAFLQAFYVPWRWRDRWSLRENPPALGRWLLWLVLFLLMFESGLVKWQSYGNDDGNTWRNLTALDYHYWTQPIPSWTSWLIHQGPAWFDRWSIRVMLFIELVLPFFIFLPRRLRHFGGLGQIFLQALIIGSGNYGFFNLLTIVLCLPLFDDVYWSAWGWRRKTVVPVPARDGISLLRFLVTLPVFLVFLAISSYQLWNASQLNRPFQPRPNAAVAWLQDKPALQRFYTHLSAWHVANPYGLFRVMTTTRPEIEISGSHDGREWKPYLFRYKPGPPERAPPQIFPGHLPRVDWRMWFAAMQLEGTGRLPPWMTNFLAALADGRPEVLSLLAHDPFPETLPTYLRLQLYQYEFTAWEDQAATGHYWRRELDSRFTIVLRAELLRKAGK